MKRTIVGAILFLALVGEVGVGAAHGYDYGKYCTPE